MKIAVFHHGLHSMRGDPDHLTASEFGRFVNAGFQLGLHGHTHQDEFSDNAHDLRRRVPLISTGSFAAGARERPDGERNQASLLELGRNLIRWTIHSRARNEQWRKAPANVYWLPAIEPKAEDRLTDKCLVETHERAVEIRPDGIATVTITLRGVTFDGELLLACPSRRANAAVADDEAEFVQRSQQTHRRRVIDRGKPGAPVLVINGSAAGIDTINFRYHVANAFALDPVDLEYMQRPSFAAELGLGADEDAWVYALRSQAKKLMLTVSYPEGCMVQAPVGRAQEHVGKGVLFAPESEWRDDPRESEHIECTHSERRASLTVMDPRPSCRYSLKYRIRSQEPRQFLPDANDHLLTEVLRQCRASTKSPLREMMTQVVGAAISEKISVSPEEADTWVAHLWNGQRRRLEPAFGVFPPEDWGTDFEYGEGVVGHAFRVRAPAVYLSEPQSSSREKNLSRLIYRQRSGGALRWVVCVPIWSQPNIQFGAMGVIGFGMSAGATPSKMQKKLEHIARNFAMSPRAKWTPEGGAAVRDPLTTLAISASFMFWEALQHATSLDEHADFIRSVIADHWHRDRMSDVAPKPGAAVPPVAPQQTRRKRK